MSAYFEHQSFAGAYEQLLRCCLTEPDYVTSPRGMEVRELVAPTIRVLNPVDRLYTSPARSTPMRYLAGEFVWYFSLRNDAEFISRYSSFWNKLKNERTSGWVLEGAVNSSYGHLAFDVFDAKWGGRGVSQWEWALASMLKDPDTRQAVVHINRPNHQHDWIKDFPCTMSLQFLIRDRKLNLVVHMRSNDLIMGLTFDFPMFAFFQEVMLYNVNRVGEIGQVELGHLTLMAGSSHIYQRDYDKVERMLADGIVSVPELAVPLGASPIEANRVEQYLTIKKTPVVDWLLAVCDGAADPDETAEWTRFPWYAALARELSSRD